MAIAFGAFLIISIVSGVVSILGILTGIGAWQNKTDVSVEQVDTCYGPFSAETDRLELEIGAADIEIATGDALALQTDNPYITVTEKNGTLVIKESSHVADLEGSFLRLSIPEGMEFDRVKLVTGAGRLQIGTLSCQNLECELGAGKTEIQSLTVTGEADIDGGAGQFIIHDGSIHDLDFDMGIGEADLFARLTGDSEITAGIGALVLTLPAKLEDYTIYPDQGMGRVEVDGMTVTGRGTLGSGPDRLELEGGIGSISVYFEPRS